MADNSRPPVTGYPVPPPSTYSNGYRLGPHSNAAYPYATPHPQYADYQYYAPNRHTTFVRYFVVATIASLLIIGTVLAIVRLVLLPRLPEFRVESVTLTNLSVSISSQHVSGDWLVWFQVANPNKKMKISYTDVVSYIDYKSESLSATRLPPFYQGTSTQMAVQASFAAVDSYVDGWAVRDINAERASGAVSFQVRLTAFAQFGSGWWPARREWIRVFCGKLAVGLPSNNGTGMLTSGGRQCIVE